jgi:hypothetical protein
VGRGQWGELRRRTGWEADSSEIIRNKNLHACFWAIEGVSSSTRTREAGRM